ncbi:terpene synthase family protein [Amycolatopsis thailandensis]|uniref:terpene synthase family protein n=1 Tax=Amycolatopsis thailandensis TaxID=589330 RepID=UPI0036409855
MRPAVPARTDSPSGTAGLPGSFFPDDDTTVARSREPVETGPQEALVTQSPVPRLSLPLPECPPHPSADALEEQAYRWALDRGLVDERGHRKLAASRIVTCGTGYFGDAPPKLLETISRWYVWLVVLDDFVDDELISSDADEQRHVMDNLLAELSAIFAGEPVEPGNPLSRAVAEDLWPGVSQGTSPCWRARFGADCRLMVESIWWDARVRCGLSEQPRDLAAYLARRRQSIGASIFCDMLEVILDLSIGDEFHRSPIYRELIEAVLDTTGWVNDVWSVPKDVADGELNLVLLLAAQENRPWQDSVRPAMKMIEARVEDFVAHQRALPRVMEISGFGAQEVDQGRLLASRLAFMIQACVDCHQLSARWAE